MTTISARFSTLRRTNGYQYSVLPDASIRWITNTYAVICTVAEYVALSNKIYQLDRSVGW